MWENVVQPDRPQVTIWRMRIAWWIPKATNTYCRNIEYLLLFCCNNGYKNALHCYVILVRTLPVSGFLLYKAKQTYPERAV